MKNFTAEEIFKIKSSLDRTIVIQPLCKSELNANDVLTDTHSVITDCKERLISDAVTTSARASSSVLDAKARELGLNKSTLIIEKRDYINVTSHLIATSFIGRTGLLQFDDTCHRVADTFLASNVIINKDDFTNTLFDNCELDYKAYIYTFRQGGKVKFMNNHTFVFKDNTTNIPSDKYKRIYERSEYM